MNYQEYYVNESIAPPFKKFAKGSRVKIKATGKEVTVIKQDDIGLVFTMTDDATKVPPKATGAFVKGYKEYMPKELELVK